MKIAILTQPLRYNYGGLLQNYALQTTLKRLGHKPITLDINEHIYTDWTTPLRVIKRAIWKYIFHKQKVAPYWEYKKNHEYRLLETNTGKFIRKHIEFKSYRNINNLDLSIFDAFIVGSDQVWRPRYSHGRLDDMFLCFSEGMKVKRIAYAASFGTDNWEFSEEQTNKYCHFISLFNAISVREDSGIELCRRYFKKNAVHVLDPTMLLTKEDYFRNILSTQTKDSSKYLFYYILDSNDKKEQIVKEYAERLHLNTITVRAKDERSKEIGQRIQPPLEDWLSAISKAEYVITDSFHGTVFSIIFNRPFTVILNEERGSSRIESLLKCFNLENRLYKACNNVNTRIDWNQVNCILSARRKMSIDFLVEYLNE